MSIKKKKKKAGKCDGLTRKRTEIEESYQYPSGT